MQGGSNYKANLATTTFSVISVNLSATASGTISTISWDAVSGADSYNLYWASASGVTTLSNEIPGVTSPYEHTIGPGVTRYYRLSYVDNSVESGLSEEVSATTPTPFYTNAHTVDSYLVRKVTINFTTSSYLIYEAPGITADLWQTFEFDTLSVANLEANDNCSEGSWTISNSASRVTITTAAEKQAPSPINGVNDVGTRGLGYTNSGTAYQPGYVRYTFASGKSTGLSWGFWFYAAHGMVGAWTEHDICSMYILSGSDDVYIKANDFATGSNLDLFIHNGTVLLNEQNNHNPCEP